jgi:hypothetical protein
MRVIMMRSSMQDEDWMRRREEEQMDMVRCWV